MRAIGAARAAPLIKHRQEREKYMRKIAYGYRWCVGISVMNVAIIMYDNNQITSARECARGRNGVKSSSFHAGFSSSATFLVSPPSLVFSFLLRIRIALLLFILISHRRSDPPTTKTSRALVSNALWRHWTLYDVVAEALIREDRGRSNGDAKSHPGNVSDNVTLIRALIRNRDLNSGTNYRRSFNYRGKRTDGRKAICEISLWRRSSRLSFHSTEIACDAAERSLRIH